MITRASSRTAGRHGFTLIEVVIGSALMSLITVSAYVCFNAAIESRKTMEPRLEVIQNARVAMACLAADLRSACALDKEFAFLGMRRAIEGNIVDNLDFGTLNHTPRRAREGDFCQVSYYVDRNTETGQMSLWRRRNPAIAPDPLSGGSKEEIATGIRSFECEYYDGLDWHTTWGDSSGSQKRQTSQNPPPNLSGMPEAVRVVLAFESEPPRRNREAAAEESRNPPPPLVFKTVVQLNLTKASRSASSATTASSASGAADAAQDSSNPQSGARSQ